MIMRIYLIGFMGSGKTTVGKKLAKKLGYDFVDLDQLIELKCKTTIDVLFEKYDEDAFRILENKTLTETAGADNMVVATGGGTPCFYDNMTWMGAHGLTVYLKLDPGSLSDRLHASKRMRPLLKGKTKPELVDYVHGKLAEREKYYMQADIIVKGENLEMNTLLEEIKNAKKINI
jgi:shikimate kinase